MQLLKRIKQACCELRDQSSNLASQPLTGGGSRLIWEAKMLWNMLKYGARPIDYVRFEFHRKSAREKNRYLTILRYFKMKDRFGAAETPINGKVNEYKTYADFIKRDYLILDATSSADTIENFLKKHKSAIAKPVSGEQGIGVMKLSEDNKDTIRELASAIKEKPFILEETVMNCEELKDVNSSSLNTVRVTTLAPREGEAEVISVILRAGIPGSQVDNWGAGGVGYNFDIETGICNMPGKDKQNRPYIFHPGSHVKMIGFELPRYKELISYVRKLTKVYPKARYVGWDIAITPEGFDLIEMNCPAGHDMFQSFDNPIYDRMKKIK
ncbi:MAG: hypothetical protein J1E97_01535 [Muribaculaceae bacterium]|nr:hypothetical protein [Muribaculaceae bacterium]